MYKFVLFLQKNKFNTFTKMKRIYLIIILFSTLSNSQIKFEKGFYTTKDNNKVEGYIKNNDWRNNPTKIYFKESPESEVKVIEMELFNDFLIYDEAKYVKKEVLIDRYANKTNSLNYDENPSFSKEILLLRVLYEGDINLYKYSDNGLTKYFISTKNNPAIEQLIYRKYLASAEDVRKAKETNPNSEIYSNSTVLENNNYKKQLYEVLNCENIKRSEFEKLTYKSSSILSLFEKVNQSCFNNNLEKKFTNKKAKFIVTGVIDINNSQITLKDIYFNEDADLDSKINFGGGVEFEVNLPFNHYKWSIFSGINYNSYNANNQFTFTRGATTRDFDISVDYSYLQIPVGLRYYIFIKNNFENKIFFDLAFNYKQTLKFDYTETNFTEYGVQDKNNSNLKIGVGYKYKNYSIGANIYTTNNLSVNYDAMFSNVSLSLKYSFLN